MFRFTITRGWDLVISRLKAGDSGGYECQVVDRVDRTMTRVTRELIVSSEDNLISLEEDFLQRDDPSSVRGEDMMTRKSGIKLKSFRKSPRLEG